MRKVDTIASIKNGVFIGLSAVGAHLWGGWDNTISALVTFIVLDYATGLIEAYRTKNLSSKVGLMGIYKKAAILAVVAMGNVLDWLVDAGGSIRNVLIFFFIANEGLSILENAAGAGVGIPGWIKDKLEQLKGGEK